MTNKEAIKELKILREDYWNEYEDPMLAVDMAIKALEQEPCENAINIQAAIDIVRHECGEWKGLAKEIIKQFNGLPPVQPKYNTSEWCHDYKEYNHDKHCCPRFNRVIRNTVEEIKQHCEDAISREDAMNMILGYGNEIKAEVMNDIKASMIKLPSVQ